MAINHTNLFTDIGKILKYINVYATYASTGLAADLAAITAVLDSTDMYNVLSGFPEIYNSLRDSAVGWSNSLSQKIEQRLLDYTTVVSQLPLTQSTIRGVLRELIIDMIAQSKTIDKNVVTVGTVTAGGANVGDAQCVVTKVLDGISPPFLGGEAHKRYLGLDSELCVTSETMTLTAMSDKYMGGAEGAESFSWEGGLKNNSPYEWRYQGSGPGPNIVVANGRGLVLNGEFENWTTTDTPDNWTLSTGATASSTIFREDTNLKRGTYALQIKGTGAAATIKIYQSMGIGKLTPLKRYLVGCWIRGHASIAATSAFTLQFEGTGYSEGATESIDLNQAALAALTSYGFYHFFVNIPDDIPSDFALVIKATGTLTNNTTINVDGLVVKEVDWHGGVGAVIVAGATPIVKGDKYTFTLANNGAGVFQEFFRRKYGVQLPSDASPVIADSLAT